MIKVKGKMLFINECLVKSVYKERDRYFAKLKNGEKWEIDESDYLNLGGK